jgi:molybdopterin-containing oxidoreductase family iron-sulfur binding subunit
MADHRLPLRASQIEDFARMVADELDVNVGSVDSISGTWVEELVEDLKDHRGASIVIAGEQQPPEVHAVVHAINEALGNVGKTVFYTDPVEPKPMEQVAGLEELCDDMDDGDVDVLVIIGGNPAYNAPADFGFAEALSNVDTSVHLSLYYDETSSLCTWHLPATHYLEAWSDAYAYDGTVSIVQPLIAPLYGGKSAHELVAALMGEDDISGHDIVRTNWEKSNELRRTDKEWELVLQDGFIENTALKPKKVSLTSDRLSRSSKNGDGGLEIVFRPDPTVWDGSYANNGWLQETPKPITKITWDNAIMISPRTAFDMGLVNESMVQINYNGGSIQGPLWVLPGHADNSITVYLGYGRTQAGQVGSGIGYNAYPIRTSDALWFGSGAEVFSLGTSYYLASTQHHNSVEVPNTHLNERMNERVKELARMGTLHQFEQDPEFAHHIGAHGGHEPEAIFPEFETAEKKPWLSDQTGQEWEGNSWGMVIDLSACTGCNACVVACQSENNIPIVGREEVTRGREMHWIRIDRYYAGGLENPQVVHQPLGCVQCELAPCEVVCPVAATVHSLEGLNDMVYNRCVGTRYCSNNCPYKVRRFNFFEYAATDEETLKMGRNPNVSVRTRGVMEKCSYCVQRINAARIVSKRERVDLEDGDVLTACQAACPTQAITFGDISDPLSHVAQLRNEPHNYSLLGELLTKPRTTYLARVRNPNPKIEPPVEESHDGDESSAEHGA